MLPFFLTTNRTPYPLRHGVPRRLATLIVEPALRRDRRRCREFADRQDQADRKLARSAAKLRVCYENPGNHANCCRCEKCVRSILAFRLAGVPLPPAFERDVTNRQIRRVRLSRELNLDLWNELLRTAEQRGLTREPWVRAMRSTERRCHRRWWLDSLKRPFIPLRNRIRKLFRARRFRAASSPRPLPLRNR